MVAFLILVGLVLLYVLLSLTANWFFEVATEKGYPNTKYYWICFLLPGIGIPLVIALPDRGAKGKIAPEEAPDELPDELPDL